MLELSFGLPAIQVVGLVIASFLAFLVASTVGIGGPVILMPALMLALSPGEAVAMVLPPLVANGVVKLWLLREEVDWRAIAYLASTALPCAMIGAFYTSSLDPQVIKAGVAGLIILVVVMPVILRRDFEFGPRGLLGLGLLAGAAGGLAGAAGPPMAVAFKGYGLERVPFVATVAVMQIALPIVRTPGYLETGLLSTRWIPLAALMSIVAMIAVPLGRRLVERMDIDTFRKVLDVLLLLIAAWMVFKLFV